MAGKFALLIGASSFGEGGPPALAAPERDVEALRAVLSDVKIAGFRPDDVEFALNERLEKTRELLHWLFAHREKDDLLLLYYTGHGIKDPRDGKLYLALAGTKEKVPWPNSIETSVIQHQIKLSASDRKLVILDCCHSGAIGGPEGAMKGGATAAVEKDTFSPSGYGSVTLASSSAAQPSFEHHGVSIYTRAMVDALRTGAANPEAAEISAHALHKYLFAQVTKETRKLGGLMEPVYYGVEKAPLIIARNPNIRRPLDKDRLEDLRSDDPKRVELAVIILGEIMAGEDRRQAEEARTELINRLDSAADLTFRVGRRIENLLKREADRRARAVQAEPAEEREAEEGKKQQAQQGKIQKVTGAGETEPGTVFRDRLGDGSEGPEMAVLRAGEFLMGSPDTEEDRYDTEGPVHQVTIPRDFAVGCYPVTFEEYDSFAEATDEEKPHDEGWGRGSRPVINVSWEDAKAYVAWLSKQTGKPYRLLSEAEWEYACRVGTKTRYSFGHEITKKDANFDEDQTSEVGSYPHNRLGLYDMHGNVLEWVEDVWNDSYQGAPGDGSAWIAGGDQNRRVLRGGSWNGSPRGLRSAVRFRLVTGLRDSITGFRVARTLDQ